MWTPTGARRQSLTLHDELEANLAAGHIQREGFEILADDPRITSGSLWGRAQAVAVHPFADVAKAALAMAAAGHKSPASSERDNREVRLHMGSLARRDVSWITEEELQSLVNEWAATAKPRTVKRRRQILGVVFTYAQRKRFRADNPMRFVTGPAFDKRDAVHEIRREHLAPILDALYQPIYADVIRLMVATGCRPGEILALNVGDVLDDGRVIHIRGGKTENAKRDIRGLNAATAAMLMRHVGHGAKPHSPLFVFNGARLKKPTLDSGWYSALKRLGLEEHGYRLHDFRHTHAHWLNDAGYDLHVIKERLGHGTIAVTSDYYGGRTPEQDKRAGEAVGDMLDALLTPDPEPTPPRLTLVS